jgi:hypothetical protein
MEGVVWKSGDGCAKEALLVDDAKSEDGVRCVVVGNGGVRLPLIG